MHHLQTSNTLPQLQRNKYSSIELEKDGAIEKLDMLEKQHLPLAQALELARRNYEEAQAEWEAEHESFQLNQSSAKASEAEAGQTSDKF